MDLAEIKIFQKRKKLKQQFEIKETIKKELEERDYDKRT